MAISWPSPLIIEQCHAKTRRKELGAVIPKEGLTLLLEIYCRVPPTMRLQDIVTCQAHPVLVKKACSQGGSSETPPRWHETMLRAIATFTKEADF